MSENTEWRKIADDLDKLSFNEKGIARLQIDGKDICVVRLADRLLACTDRCPHAAGSLSEGFIDAHQNIVCPVHHYRFNLKTGRDAMNEGYFLKRYAVKANADGVFLKL